MKEKSKPQLRQIVNKLPLEKFIPSAFLIFLLLFIVLTTITYNSINEYRKTAESVNHTNRILKQLDEIILILNQIQVDRRGYIVKDDNKYLSSYYNRKNELKSKFGEIKFQIRDNQKQVQLVNAMDSLSLKYTALLDSSITDFEKDKANLNRDVQTFLVMSAQDNLDKVSVLAKDSKDEEIRLLNDRQASANSSLADTQIFIIVTSLFVFLVLGLTMFISNRLVTNKNAAEKLLRKSYDDLEDIVGERTSELKVSNENLINEINNRIKIETALRESEGRFRNMADSAPVLIWMSGPDKLCYYFNKSWLDFTGRTLDQEMGNGWMNGVHPEDYNRCIDIYTSAFDKRETFEMEYRLRTSSGDYRWVLDKGIPRYEGEEFAGYIGNCIDIHDRKRTERYLKIQYSVSKSLAEARTLNEALKKSLEGICIELEWQLGLIWVVKDNKLVLGGTWGKSPEFVKDYLDTYSESYTFEKGIGLPGRVWKTNTSHWIQRLEDDPNLPRKHGFIKLGWRSGLAVPISDGLKVIAVVECFNKNELLPKYDLLEVLETTGRQIGNFLERKKIEEELKESYEDLESRVKDRTIELANTLNRLLREIEEKEKVQNQLKLFGHAIRSVKECIFITDLDNNTIFTNSAFETIYGYFEEELLGKKIPVLYSAAVNDDLREEILQSTGRGGWKGELKNTRKDGSEFFIYLSTTVIRNDDGKVQAIVGICQDITESKHHNELLEKRYRLLNLLNDVIVVVNKSFNAEASISYAINKMCEYASWDVGHCFLLNEGRLVSSKIWNGNFPVKFLEFKTITEQAEFEKGEGMPGKCMEKNEAFWEKIKSFSDPAQYKRAQVCNKVGLKTGVWAPIKTANKVVGVIEFFNSEEKEQDNEILDSISNIGIEIGSLFERNEILEKIRESEESLRLIIENVKDGIIQLDPNGNIVSWNRGAEAIKGYKAEEIIGKHFSIFYTEDEIAENEPEINLQKTREYGRLTREGWRIRKDGTLFWADIVFNALYDDEGELIGYVKVTRDSTERKKAEEAIIYSEKQLKEAQKIARLGSWEWNIKTDIVEWSEEMYNLYEVSPEEFKPSYNDFLSMLHPDDVEMVKKNIDDAYKNKSSFDFYERILTPSGKTRILRSQGSARTDSKGKVTKLVGTCLDVTEVKEAEETIIKSEKQLKGAQQIAKLGSWEVDLKTNQITWSEEMYRIFEADTSKGPQPYEGLRHLIHPDDVSLMDKTVEQVGKKAGNIELNFRLVTPKGRIKYLITDIRTEFDANSNPIRLFGSVQDITEIKLVEEELRKTNARLIEAQKELIHSEKLAALGRFSSGIAHEIRNPLANISALAQLLSKTKIDDEKTKKHLKYILVNSDIANNIIKQLLHFASPEDLVFTNENLKDLLDNIVNSIEPRCIENKINISKQIDIPSVSMSLDKTKLENALLNFASNSIEAMPRGGNLTIKASSNCGNEVVIDVIDTGTGIAQENLDKIFEPFFTTKQAGTGLGLGLAYQTIRLHHGVLNISSEPGKGTHVEIKLPINGKNFNN